jgi:hypothetical protein
MGMEARAHQSAYPGRETGSPTSLYEPVRLDLDARDVFCQGRTEGR